MLGRKVTFILLGCLIVASASIVKGITLQTASAASVDYPKSRINNIDLYSLYEAEGITDTGSMLPTMGATTKVLLQPVDSINDLIVGDIITFKTDNQVVIHRIVQISSDDSGWYCKTKGDANGAEDNWLVRPEQIEKVVVALFY